MLRRSLARMNADSKIPHYAHTPKPYEGLAIEKVKELRSKFLTPCHKHLYMEPLILSEASMQYVYDHTGKRYLDMFGGVCTIAAGHSHPKVVKAMQDQLALINHTTHLYLTPVTFELMEEINKHLPKAASTEDEWVFHFTNSGSEANDFATLCARAYTRNHSIIGMRNGYHGMTEGTRGLVSVPGWKHAVPSPSGILRAIAPIPYRGKFRNSTAVDGSPLSEADTVPLYVQDLKETILAEAPNSIAAFIAEAIQGVGGLYPLLPGYLPAAYDIVRANGGVCISDEVQTGWGRLGSHYWGFESQGVVPDIITCAKSLGNGAPIGLTIMKRKIANAIKDVAFFNTYGGNPVSCAGALANLRVIEEDGLQDRAKVVGTHNIHNLQGLKKQYPEIIGDVRGAGFMVGVELVASSSPDRTPLDGVKVVKVVEGLREKGILVGKGGTHGNVIRCQGPMCATIEDMDFFAESLEDVIKAGL